MTGKEYQALGEGERYWIMRHVNNWRRQALIAMAGTKPEVDIFTLAFVPTDECLDALDRCHCDQCFSITRKLRAIDDK